MNYAAFIPIMMLWIIILANSRKKKQFVRNMIERKNKSGKEKVEMIELAKRYIGKECIFYMYDGNQIVGVLKEVTDGGLLIENGKHEDAVNLDFILRIREYPRDKKGKKKSVVLD